MIKPYEKNKHTKNIWYPEVPSHWVLIKVKYVAKTIAGGTPSTDKSEYWEKGDIPWLPSGKLQNCDITTAEKFITKQGFNNSSTKLIKPNTTLIALTGATCANIGFLKFQACANQSVVAINEFPGKADSRFLFYMFLSMRKQILTHQSGGAQAGINDGNVKNLFLVVPPLSEQTKIAQYLDHQTAIIDQLILQKEKLIELLKEKRQAVINEAVTKGLNPNAKMKDSGIEWLGEVPEHWTVLKFRYLIDVLTDFTANGSFADLAKNVTYLDEGYSRLIRLTDLRENLKNDGIYVSEESHYYLSKSALYGNEILLANVGAYAGLAWKVQNLIEPSTLGPNMFLLKFYNDLNNDFAYFSLISEYLSSQLKNKAISSAQPKLNKEDVRSCLFVLPALEEQFQIVKYLLDANKKFDKVIKEETVLIEKLKEYRQSIISEAVTGKIDVRDWQPNNPHNN